MLPALIGATAGLTLTKALGLDLTGMPGLALAVPLQTGYWAMCYDALLTSKVLQVLWFSDDQ